MLRDDLAENQEAKAMKKYHSCYNNQTYIDATWDKTSQYANALIDECMALCGSPYYKLSSRRWGKAAIKHLRLFTKEESVDIDITNQVQYTVLDNETVGLLECVCGRTYPDPWEFCLQLVQGFTGELEDYDGKPNTCDCGRTMYYTNDTRIYVKGDTWIT